MDRKIIETPALMREHGNFIYLSSNLSEEDVKIADELLLDSMRRLAKHCPDAIFQLEPTIVPSPAVDKLQRFAIRSAKMIFASSIYDYFYALKKVELETAIAHTKSQLAYQSRKSWWTRLCWKLGGFDMKNGDLYE